ncbi:hypothetical protein GOV14_00840 [Candidatus Pacearchaeota archaeon]|nr:hypothetical protein [Candidatus Pacearchaeota archaeon]
MGTLDQITQMKSQGLPEGQIAQNLRAQGISPKEITEALSQSKIKSAISPAGSQETIPYPGQDQGMNPQQMPQGMNPQQPMPSQMNPQQAPQSMDQQQMQPSIGQQTQPATQSATVVQPQTQEAYPGNYQQEVPTTLDYAQTTQPQDQYYQDYSAPAYSDVGTMNDIAEQIVEEKNTKIHKQITEIIRFKEEATFSLVKMSERLEKIETMFHELQVAILGKIGEYGEDVKNISQEMHATQDTFSKFVNPLTDNISELKKIAETAQKTPKTAPKK